MHRKTLYALVAAVAAMSLAASGLPVAAASASSRSTADSGWQVGYAAYGQDYAWQSEVFDGQMAGTTGRGLRIEALKVRLNPVAFPGASICYSAHVQDIGWQPEVCDAVMAGTNHQSRRIEAVTLRLVNAPGYHVCYSAHVQNIGWQPEVCDGALAGTTGQGLRMEALRIRITTQTTPPPTPVYGSQSSALTPDTALVAELQDHVGNDYHFVVDSKIRVSPTTQRIDGTTHVWSTYALRGFHGGDVVELLDQGGNVIYVTQPHVMGVDGEDIPFSTSSRIWVWSENVPAAIASAATQIDIIHVNQTGGVLVQWWHDLTVKACNYVNSQYNVGLKCPN
jgi:uncharacterized protein YjdB